MSSIPFGLDEPVSGSSSDAATAVALCASESTSTLSDAVSRLSDRAGTFEYDSGSGNDPREQRRLIQAVRSAVRDIASVYDWRYYQAGYRVTTSEYVNATSATYVASTGTLTINSAQTWPSDAIYGEVTIGDVRYPIASRTSSTVIVLKSTMKRTTDYSGSVQWTRSRYTIPLIRGIHGLWEEGPERPLAYVSPAEFRSREIGFPSGGTPVIFTVEQGDRDHYLALSSAPTTSRSYMLAAKLAPAYPRVFRDYAYASGTAGEFTVDITDASTVWVGAMLRVPRSGLATTDAKTQSLLYDDWDWQAIITGIDGVTLTLSSALPRDIASELVLVSSPINVSTTMQTYFESLAYERYCRNHKHDSLADAVRIASADLMRAMEADAIASDSARITLSSDRRPLYDIHSEEWQ